MISIITQDKDFFPLPLREKFEFIKEMGFDGIEIDGSLLLNRFEEVQQAAEASGLPVVSACGGYTGWIGDFKEERRQQASDNQSCSAEDQEGRHESAKSGRG